MFYTISLGLLNPLQTAQNLYGQATLHTSLHIFTNAKAHLITPYRFLSTTQTANNSAHHTHPTLSSYGSSLVHSYITY
jgi:hypothetical protein